MGTSLRYLVLRTVQVQGTTTSTWVGTRTSLTSSMLQALYYRSGFDLGLR